LPTVQLLNNAYPHWRDTPRQSITEQQAPQPVERELTQKEIEALSPAELDAEIRKGQIAYLKSRFK
jgi:hypothetical protein